VCDGDYFNALIVNAIDDRERKPAKQISPTLFDKGRISFWGLNDAVYCLSNLLFEGTGSDDTSFAIPSSGRDRLLKGVGMKPD
jgi:hypothetical protein